MKILSFMERNGIKFKRIGQSYVCRCPICKRDNNLKKHNAQVNPESNNIYCYSEGKTYCIKDLRSLINTGRLSC